MDGRVETLGRLGAFDPGHGHVAAADVEADAADRNVFLVGDDAADRLGIAERPSAQSTPSATLPTVMHRAICCFVLSSWFPNILNAITALSSGFPVIGCRSASRTLPKTAYETARTAGSTCIEHDCGAVHPRPSQN